MKNKNGQCTQNQIDQFRFHRASHRQTIDSCSKFLSFPFLFSSVKRFVIKSACVCVFCSFASLQFGRKNRWEFCARHARNTLPACTPLCGRGRHGAKKRKEKISRSYNFCMSKSASSIDNGALKLAHWRPYTPPIYSSHCPHCIFLAFVRRINE